MGAVTATTTAAQDIIDGYVRHSVRIAGEGVRYVQVMPSRAGTHKISINDADNGLPFTATGFYIDMGSERYPAGLIHDVYILAGVDGTTFDLVARY